ncbi:MAG: TonB-dependent receptor domain-containing protein [Flavobacteriales bacterium]|jgi:outer membrane receptor protein involved in Fe transport|tara:strand:+ start:3843 stop:6290 length:2448 start_codon:yes stop_codon:yes gene_type:complete
MTKNLLIVVLFILSHNYIMGQKNVNLVLVSGKIIEIETNLPLEYATITFFSKVENKMKGGGITDPDGNFSISIPQGTYDVSVEYFSFENITKLNVNFNQDTNLGTLKMNSDLQALDAVDIIAEKTTVEIKLDKKIYNVGRDLTVRGGSVSDVLDNVPSVSVDIEGNVALRGNGNVRILINGKPSGLVGLNSTDALRQLPADAIEKVEIITSPSARYDAEGTAGILNIILRRSKILGLNGAIIINSGYPNQLGASGNINYRTGDINVFNNSGYSYRKSPGSSGVETEFFNTEYDEDGILIQDSPNTFRNEYRTFERIRKGFNSNTGVEWYITPTTSLTTAFLASKSNNSNESFNRAETLDLTGAVISESVRYDPETETDQTTQFSVNFDKQFHGNSEHRLTFDFQLENSSEDEGSIIYNEGIAAERVRTIEDQKRVLIQSDFTLPINDKTRFEGGYNGRFSTNNTAYSLEFAEDDSFILDTNISNVLVYKENVNAVYTQYGSKVKDKFSFLLGLRMEATNITISQLSSNEYTNSNYIGLFPTVNLGYEFSENQNLTIGYNRRISRPRSRFLNPFPSRSSATNLFQGNPNISPSYSNGVDIGYLNTLEKITLNTSLYYNHATDVFTYISEDTGDEVVINGESVPVIRRGPINLAEDDRLGFEFTLTYRPSKKWNMNANFNLYHSAIKGNYKGLSYDSENLGWFVRLNNKYTLPGNIEWQTRLSYSGPTVDAINRREGIFSSNMAFSKDLFKEKASITLNINDLFNTQRRNLESTTPTFYSDGYYRWRVRSYSLSFTYRFNQAKKRSKQGQYGSDFTG